MFQFILAPQRCIAFLAVVMMAFAADLGFSQAIVSWNSALLNSNQYCPANAPISVLTSGYRNVGSGNSCPNDSVGIVYSWGDGTVDSVYLPYEGSSYYCFFDTTISHVYQIPGTFQIQVKMHDPIVSNDVQVLESFELYSSCTKLSGNVIYDQNKNCQTESNEATLSKMTITVFDQSNQVKGVGFTNDTGYFECVIPSDSQSYFAIPTSEGFDTSYCSNNYLPFIANGDTAQDFFYQCNANFNLKSKHGFSRIGAPGESGFLTFRIHASTCTNQQAMARLILDNDLIYEQITLGPAPDSIAGNKYFWNLNIPMDSLAVVQMPLKVRMKVRTKTTATIGSDVTLKASAFSSTNELITTDNHDVWDLEIGGPYDPNNKLVSPQGKGASGQVGNNIRLTYLINFQNTGNDTARNVFVIDSLSDLLNHGSVRIVDSKHPMKVMYDKGYLRFDFPNIHLPDSNTNEEESKGWFIFSVDMKDDLPVQSVIENFVDIYFDYNPPIRTNTAVNTIVDYPELVTSFDVKNNTCKFNSNAAVNLEVSGGFLDYDVMWSDGSESVDRTQLMDGNYALTITDGAYSVRIDTVAIYSEDSIAPVIDEVLYNSVPVAGTSQWLRVNREDSVTYSWLIDGAVVTDTQNHRIKVTWLDTAVAGITVQGVDSNQCEADLTQSIYLAPLSSESRTLESLVVNPNPTLGIIEISGDISWIQHVQLFDMKGRIVQEIRSTGSLPSVRMDLSSEPVGIYTLRLVGEKQIKQTKVLVIRH